jgi:hypothetical protein
MLDSAHFRHGISLVFAYLDDDIKGSLTKIRGTGRLKPEVATEAFGLMSLTIIIEVEGYRWRRTPQFDAITSARNGWNR